MIPHRIGKISASDYGCCASTLSSCCPSEEESAFILSILESEELRGVAIKSRQGALGFALVSHDLKGTFFPKSLSTRKEVDMLEEAEHQDENVLALQGIYVEPRLQKQGLGKEIISSLESFYPKSTWLALVEENNRVAKAFFLSCGFVDKGPISYAERGIAPHLFVKKYRPFGLCREAKW